MPHPTTEIWKPVVDYSKPETELDNVAQELTFRLMYEIMNSNRPIGV